MDDKDWSNLKMYALCETSESAQQPGTFSTDQRDEENRAHCIALSVGIALK
jgi:hypothetical protein